MSLMNIIIIQNQIIRIVLFLSDVGASTETITFSSNGGLGFYTALNNQQYQVLDRTETSMYLRNVGSEGNSWYGKFTTDVLSNPNFDQLQLRIYPNPSEYGLYYN